MKEKSSEISNRTGKGIINKSKKRVSKSFLFIFDLDQTLVDSDIALELRAKGKWSASI